MLSGFNPFRANLAQLPGLNPVPRPGQEMLAGSAASGTSTSTHLNQRSQAYQTQLQELNAQLDIYAHQTTQWSNYKKRLIWAGVGFLGIAIIGGALDLSLPDQRDKPSTRFSHSTPTFHENPLAVAGKDVALASMCIACCCFLFAIASHYVSARAANLSFKLSNDFAAQRVLP